MIRRFARPYARAIMDVAELARKRGRRFATS